MPYQLKVENISRYMETCHFCGIHTCKINCPVPYSSSMTENENEPLVESDLDHHTELIAEVITNANAAFVL